MLSQKIIKILILGDSGVGKSTFVHTFINGYKNNTIPMDSTIGTNFESVKINYKNTSYKLFFYDSPGQEKAKSLLNISFKEIDCFIFIYDVTKESTYNNIKEWIHFTKQALQKYNRIFDDCTSIIITNKYDLIKEDNEKNNILNKGKELVEETNITAIICSSILDLDGFTPQYGIQCLMDEYTKNKNNNDIISRNPENNKIELSKIIKIENNDNCACISQ